MALFRHHSMSCSPHATLLLNEDLAALKDVFDFVSKFRRECGISAAAPTCAIFKSGLSLYREPGERLARSSAFLRIIEVHPATLAAALGSGDQGLDARGTIVHELVHAGGHVRVSLVREGSLAAALRVSAQGLVFPGLRTRFEVLEEYLASRVQSLYYAAHGSPESDNRVLDVTTLIPSATTIRHTAAEQAVLVAAKRLPRTATAEGVAGRWVFEVPTACGRIRCSSPYGIIRSALYKAAHCIFRHADETKSIREFDRLAYRAHTLGEYRPFFGAMTRALGAQAVIALGSIPLASSVRPSAMVLAAAWGEAMRLPRRAFNRRMSQIAAAAVQLQAEARANFLHFG
jgi:hypothetical protein